VLSTPVLGAGSAHAILGDTANDRERSPFYHLCHSSVGIAQLFVSSAFSTWNGFNGYLTLPILFSSIVLVPQLDAYPDWH
jgi:hypothetical protein